MLDMTEECDQNDITVPLIIEDGYDIAVKVDAPVKQLSRLETYVSYRVRTVSTRWPTPDHVRRRYNHFKVLHKRLVSSHPLLPVPPLPPLHSARQQLDRYGAHFVAVRAMALDCMLNRIAKHPILSHSDEFRIFVTAPDEDVDRVLKQQPTPWHLSSVYPQEHRNTAARVKDPEFSSALDYLQSLQQKLTALCTITNKLCKYQNAAANEYEGLRSCLSNWQERTATGCAKGCISPTTSSVYTKCEAVLPTLANYSSVLVDKIKERDQLHAAYIGGSNNNDALHNRLEQASEALRSELQDWNAKTKSELKELLLELATSQINLHERSLRAWEDGLRISTQTNPEEIFKTVSRNCVQNLSPSRCKPETPTDVDIDSINSNYDDLSAVEELIFAALNTVDEQTKSKQNSDLTRDDTFENSNSETVDRATIEQHSNMERLEDIEHSNLESKEKSKKEQDNLKFENGIDSNCVETSEAGGSSDLEKELLIERLEEMKKCDKKKMAEEESFTDPLTAFSEVDLTEDL